MIVCGCGRIGFDVGGASIDAPTDATPLPRRCPLNATTPDAITLSGRTLRISFIGIPSAESDVTVSMLDGVAGTPLATTTSAGNGDFSLVVTTSGAPITPVLSLTATNALTSVFVGDEPIDRDVAMIEGFIGSGAAVGSLYGFSPASRDLQLGTIFIRVADCDEDPVSGVSIALSPPAEDIVYAGPAGFPSSSATETSSSGFAWALNVAPGPVVITASKAGETFLPTSLEVLGGDHFMGAVVRPVSP